MKSLQLFLSMIKPLLRKKINLKNRERLLNTEFSLIASNCNGAVICNDLNLKFNSPFVNLWMYPSDFIKYLSNIEYYMTCDLRFINA